MDLDIQPDLLPNRRKWPEKADTQRLPKGAFLGVKGLDEYKDIPLKKRGRLKKIDLSVEGYCETIIELKEKKWSKQRKESKNIIINNKQKNIKLQWS